MNEAFSTFHFSDVAHFVPDSLIPILCTLALSFLIGLEREEHAKPAYLGFGGIRTFPMIGVCGYLIAKIANNQPTVLGAGILVMGALFCLSYRKKLESSLQTGMTSEISGMFTFLLGMLIYGGAIWEATTLAVVVLLLLELKGSLESLARKLPPLEIYTFTRFLLISAVILPIVPNREISDFHLNPFHTWLIVVVISTLSYLAYAIGKLMGSRQSVLLSAILGGLYSSTATTVVLAKRSRQEPAAYLFSGAILVASGLMYFRMVALICIFNWDLGAQIAIPFLILGLIATLGGIVWMKKEPKSELVTPPDLNKGNPLELKSAMLFAVIFTAMSALTLFARLYFGQAGVYGLAFLTGLSDVDPFVMNLTQSAGKDVLLPVAVSGIVIATASNNVMKGIYAMTLGSKAIRFPVIAMLLALSALSLGTLILLPR